LKRCQEKLAEFFHLDEFSREANASIIYKQSDWTAGFHDAD
jgi:hypothetical protein